MSAAIGLLALLCSIVSLVCWIMVLIKMFGQSILTGILGIICGIYAIIWGFMNKDAAGLNTVMLVWAIAILAGIGLQFAMFSMGASAGANPFTP